MSVDQSRRFGAKTWFLLSGIPFFSCVRRDGGRQLGRQAGNGSKERVMARGERQERDKQVTKIARDNGQRQCRSSRQAKALGIFARRVRWRRQGRRCMSAGCMRWLN
jgi:hypothetical protein